MAVLDGGGMDNQREGVIPQKSRERNMVAVYSVLRPALE